MIIANDPSKKNRKSEQLSQASRILSRRKVELVLGASWPQPSPLLPQRIFLVVQRIFLIPLNLCNVFNHERGAAGWTPPRLGAHSRHEVSVGGARGLGHDGVGGGGARGLGHCEVLGAARCHHQPRGCLHAWVVLGETQSDEAVAREHLDEGAERVQTTESKDEAVARDIFEKLSVGDLKRMMQLHGLSGGRSRAELTTRLFESGFVATAKQARYMRDLQLRSAGQGVRIEISCEDLWSRRAASRWLEQQGGKWPSVPRKTSWAS